MEQIANAIMSIAKALNGGTGVTGQITLYGGVVAPLGFLICDGTSYLRSDYPALFSVLGTGYGSADSTHFNVPDLRGRVPVGKNAGTFGALGNTGGEETHLLTIAEMPSHTHSQNLGVPWSTVANVAGTGVIGNANYSNTAATGGGGAHNNIQPYQVVNYVVKI